MQSAESSDDHLRLSSCSASMKRDGRVKPTEKTKGVSHPSIRAQRVAHLSDQRTRPISLRSQGPAESCELRSSLHFPFRLLSVSRIFFSAVLLFQAAACRSRSGSYPVPSRKR